ncbi:two-component system cell cycle response regulator DivK [Mucilaginibacter gracilis]|uniref:Two-component system cell cycle response regulator DivK n=1 Tax=Mucilaginibacter gracilis TaxID=423350 RepID=A0A495IZU5_9SPHI|nr:response regulator [Mucilaginibacter gracilis]RKR81901.1 two-component system cell cycle response regulator DivK [Mucilaginibacter gracilis]
MSQNLHKRVIIFDDDEDILSICTYILEEKGWDVHTFTNCNNILDKVSSISPDVILMDNWIPDIGGMLATQLLKGDEGMKEIPVIYFSANNDIHTLAANAGADSYLAKPFDIDELEKVINRVVLSREF